MRRFRSISDYLSLGAGPPSDAAHARLLGPTWKQAVVRQAPRPFEQRTVLSAERLTVAHLREAVAQLARDGVPPIPNVGRTVLRGVVDADTGERLRVDEDPEAIDFGPYYEVSMPPADMTALCGDPEFQAGEAAGEFRVAGKGRILVRPPREET